MFIYCSNKWSRSSPIHSSSIKWSLSYKTCEFKFSPTKWCLLRWSLSKYYVQSCYFKIWDNQYSCRELPWKSRKMQHMVYIQRGILQNICERRDNQLAENQCTIFAMSQNSHVQKRWKVRYLMPTMSRNSSSMLRSI